MKETLTKRLLNETIAYKLSYNLIAFDNKRAQDIMPSMERDPHLRQRG